MNQTERKEIKEYFTEKLNCYIEFKYQCGDDKLKAMAISQMTDKWKCLRNGMEVRRQRSDLGLIPAVLNRKELRHIPCEEFVNKDLILFSHTDRDRFVAYLKECLETV